MLEKLKKHWKIAVILVLAALGGFFFWQNQNNLNKLDTSNSIIKGLNDSVKVYKDKQGREHAEIGVIEVTDPKDFLILENLKGENKKLQDLVKEYKKKLKEGSSVTYVESETKTDVTVPTKVDTIEVEKVKYLTYTSEFDKDGWVFGKVIAKPDSTFIDVGVKNEFGLVIGQHKRGFLGLGKPETFADVVSYNPYTKTNKVKSLQVKVQNPNRIYWLGGGIVIGIVGGILIAK